MNRLPYIFILMLATLMSVTSSAQNMYTNAPEQVFPILEEFVAENYKRHERSFDLINRIDSIVVKNIPPVFIPATAERPAAIEKVYGYHKKLNGREWIEIDSSLLKNPRKLHSTLLHELKHAKGYREHIDATGYHFNHPIYEDIMAIPSYPYYIGEDKWERMKKKYYDSLTKSPQP